ncbi:MAG: hypothetical protein IJ193_09355 [Bacilli bacterium]|nr:hypothetical protein [Bacilli bacterium]
MKVITVCGSMKYYKEMMEEAEKIELQGNCVLTPLYNPNRPSKESYTEEEGIMLDKVHKERIKLSDAIFVMNIGGHIGNSTRSEIEYAKSLGKEIIYLEQ